MQWFKILTVLFIVGNFIGCGPDKKQDVLSFFNDAAGVYKNGEYDKAIGSYEQMVDSGFVSGEVYYNLGNSYFKKGSLGKAILNYERARRLLPRDSDLLSNLKYAHASIKNLPAQPQKSFGKKILAYVEYLSSDEEAVIGLIALLGLIVVHLLGLYFRWPSLTKAGMLSFVVVIFMVHLGACFLKASDEKSAAIILVATEARFEPETKATAHFYAAEGLCVKIIEENSGWIKVQRLDGNEGWLPREVLQKI